MNLKVGSSYAIYSQKLDQIFEMQMFAPGAFNLSVNMPVYFGLEKDMDVVFVNYSLVILGEI